MALTREQIVPPVLPSKTVAVAGLGGEVIVRGLRLSERLSLFADIRAGNGGYENMARLLAMTVVGDDGKPLLTQEEWEAHGCLNQGEVIDLFREARALSGLDDEVIEKN